MAAAPPAPEVVKAQAKAALGRLPLRFEANQGQWSADVRYAARTGGGALLLTERGPALLGGARRVDIAMLHGNRKPRIEALNPMRAKTNYFVGSRERWRTGVENFTRVVYRSVYRGIDIVYYGNQNQLEYDFVLRPGAEPQSIRMRFRGAESVELTADGELAVKAGGAEFVQKRPLVYQEDPQTGVRRPVEGRYELLARGTVGLRLSSYDRSRSLVIDPVVTYSLFVGGSGADVINAVATDSLGFIYVAGSTSNGTLLPYGNAEQPNYSAGLDGFIAKFDPNFGGDATWVYFTYLGGGRDDVITAMLIDSVGNMDVTGTTTSSDFPVGGYAVQSSLALSTTSTSSVFPTDAFVTIINTNDGLEYSTYYGGTNNETPNAIARDASGLIYISGSTMSGDLPVTQNAFQTVLWGPSDIFVAVIDPTSTAPVYATYVGGEGADDGRGMVVAPNGLVYFVASTYSQLFPIVGYVYGGSPHGIENLILGAIDITQQGPASLVMTTYIGGSVLDEVRSMTMDPNGKLWLTGWTLSPDFPVTGNALQRTFSGSAMGFAMRVNPTALPTAFLEYSTFLGGSVTDIAYNLILDPAGNIWVTGYTMSPDFPVTPDALQAQYGNGIEAFLMKINPAVAGPKGLLYGTFLGGPGTHVGKGLALTPGGSVFIGGYTTADLSLPASLNIYNGGASDGFVAVFK
jgi:hypothetical protein